MVSVGASEDFLTSMMNKPKELEMGEKNKNPSLKYYSELSFQERGQKLGENLSFPIWTNNFKTFQRVAFRSTFASQSSVSGRLASS